MEWEEQHAVIVGRSLSTFVRSHTTPASAVDAWRRNYSQLEQLFIELVGFDTFMEVIAEYVLRNSKAGMALRVASGAFLSMLDGFTDIFVITTYYGSPDLVGQANALLAMCCMPMLGQLGVVFCTYQKKSEAVKIKEALITLFFLRPAVDAYRVSTNHEDNETTLDTLTEIVLNKGSEHVFESISGCVLQVFVWLSNPEQAGTFALLSFAVSAMTTGFTSAMIAYDFDVVAHRCKHQPKFYGYIPDDNGLRGRCFVLMLVRL